MNFARAQPDLSIFSPSPDAAATFDEHEELKSILLAGNAHFDIQAVAEISARSQRFSVFTASLGTRDPLAPAVGFFGGIHGLERIGTQVILHYMRALLFRLEWDELLHQQLQKVRLVFMPIVNPGGMFAFARANPNGVDLMRNAPQRAESRVPFLAGGQTVSARDSLHNSGGTVVRGSGWAARRLFAANSPAIGKKNNAADRPSPRYHRPQGVMQRVPRLLWYCGWPGAPMEIESAALLQVVRAELACRPFSLALDCHSGYGFADSIWFPYAKTRRLMPHLPEMFILMTMLEQSMPHHAYSFEPQSNQYLLHGDLWDHAYDHTPADHVFLPMTLEMGSWLWIRKNPRQLFSRHGIFNPIKAHRVKRVLRRHADLLDFLTHAAFAAPRWLPSVDRRAQLAQLATKRWRPAQAA